VRRVRARGFVGTIERDYVMFCPVSGRRTLRAVRGTFEVRGNTAEKTDRNTFTRTRACVSITTIIIVCLLLLLLVYALFGTCVTRVRKSLVFALPHRTIAKSRKRYKGNSVRLPTGQETEY